MADTDTTPEAAAANASATGAPVTPTVVDGQALGASATADTIPVSTREGTGREGTGRSEGSTAMTRVKAEAARGREQAYAAAASYADQGKGKAATALSTLSGLIIEAAKVLEENFGHRAADPVRAQADRASAAARHLETSDVDELAAELTAFAKKNPVLSVGAVAVVGFALGKLLTGSHHD